ncbi:hypothetical protein FEM48_Zijuj01G0225400 [Ziziphus jujuba var. spinosa]|uniref:Uncharacterized protein n=1 Tax=Ziziphus jujuba var. spinosa TaxID=714518 RepID=A0A978W3X8_ZIZJJ|nr:hypothetical protein FEM48_Zijuj01G0225400 [Ziziphus jujuba var. spinosa]
MENSINSTGKSSSSTNTRRSYDESPEESSWTMYFDDFLVHTSSTEHGSSSSCGESSSLISDAGSSVAKKLAAEKAEVVGLTMVDRGCSRLSFKKRKTKAAVVDDALEDTATSPVNSPKVCNQRQLEIKPKEKGNTLISQERGNSSGKMDERSDQVGFMERENDCTETELKKKGLCLVPLSMVVNYLG